MNSQANSQTRLKRPSLLTLALGTLLGTLSGALMLSFSVQAQESFEDNPALRDLQEGSLTEGNNTLENLQGGATVESGATLNDLREGARNSGSNPVDSPSTVDPAATDPAAVDPAVTDPAAVDPAAVEPAVTDPAAVDPAAVDPAAPPTSDAAAPDSSANVIARVSATNTQATVQLTNNTGAEITYEVIGQTQPRSLAAGAIARLDALPLPTTITAEREDFGLVDMGATVSPEGILEVSLERSEFDEVQGALHIRQDGYVFIN